MQNPATGVVCLSQPTLGQRGGTNGIDAPPAGATSAPAGAYVHRSRPRSQETRAPPSKHSATGRAALAVLPEVVPLALGVVLREAIALLDVAGAVLDVAFDSGHVVVGETAPAGLHLALHLVPLAPDRLSVHLPPRRRVTWGPGAADEAGRAELRTPAQLEDRSAELRLRRRGSCARRARARPNRGRRAPRRRSAATWLCRSAYRS